MDLLAKRPFILLLLFALVFVEMLTHIMFSHVADLPLRPWGRWPLLFLLVGSANKLVSLPQVGLVATPLVEEEQLLLILFTLCAVTVSIWHYVMVQEVAKALDIYVFKLGARSSAAKRD